MGMFDLASPASGLSASSEVVIQPCLCSCGRYESPLPDNFLRVRTPEDFLEAIAGDTLVVADYFVPWCIACRRFHPALIKLANKHPECTFLAVRSWHAAAQHCLSVLSLVPCQVEQCIWCSCMGCANEINGALLSYVS